jgi:exonuclease III
MDSSHLFRNWVILSWNIRGVNSESKWSAVKSKMTEARCDILCLQETKREFFDLQYIRKLCPRGFDEYTFLPSVGMPGGSLIV